VPLPDTTLKGTSSSQERLRIDPPNIPTARSTLTKSASGEGLATVSLFILIVAAFFFGSLGCCYQASDQSSAQEKRALAPFPPSQNLATDLPQFAAKFEQYFQDRAFLRLPLISARNLLLLDLLHSSGNENVLAGKADWLFFNNKETGLRPAMRHDQPFSTAALALWKKMFQYRMGKLSSQGIRYVILVAPEKSSIYPDKLPPGTPHVTGPDRISQLEECLKGTGVTFINLEDDLKRGRESASIYCKTDSHWNDIGASMAAERILEKARQCLPALPRKFEPTFKTATISGDLTDQLALHGLVTEELPVRLTPAVSPTFPMDPGLPADYAIRASADRFYTVNTNAAAKRLPRAAMLHDSFTLSMIDYLTPFFSDIHFYQTHDFDFAEITANKPDIVIEELAERHLYGYYPDNLPEMIVPQDNVPNRVKEIENNGSRSFIIGPTEFGHRFALLAGTATRTSSGLLLKLHWRSKIAQKLDFLYGIQCLGAQDLPVLAGHDMAQDARTRSVSAGAEWIETIEVPWLDLRDATRIGFMVYKPGNVLPVTAGKADSTGLRLAIPVQSPNFQ